MDSAIAGALAASVGVPLTFIVLRYLYPSRARDAAKPSLDAQSSYRRWALRSMHLWWLFTPTIGYVLYLVGDAFGAWSAGFHPKALAVLTPRGPFWVMWTLLTAPVLAGWMVDVLLRRRLGNRYEEVVRYDEQQWGVRPEGFRKLCVVLLAISGIWLVLLVDWNVRLTDRAIVVNSFWALRARTYAYADVAEIRTAPALYAPNGNRVSRREYSVRFRDGWHWSTHLDPSSGTEADKRRFIEVIASRSGVPVTEVEILLWRELS